MSEGPSGGWDSPFQENTPETDDVHAWYTTGMELLGKGSPAAAEYLALAAAMRPDRKPYTDALRQVRATLEARKRTAE